jgi:hypothetical protein
VKVDDLVLVRLSGSDAEYGARLLGVDEYGKFVVAPEWSPGCTVHVDPAAVREAPAPGPLRLYVWEGVLTDYTSGVMFALAHSVEEARDLIRAMGSGATLDLAQEPRVVEAPEGFAVWGGG